MKRDFNKRGFWPIAATNIIAQSTVQSIDFPIIHIHIPIIYTYTSNIYIYVCTQLAAIRVQLNQLRDEMENCIQTQNFTRAAEIKVKIAELDAAKVAQLNEAKPPVNEVRVEKVCLQRTFGNDKSIVLKK